MKNKKLAILLAVTSLSSNLSAKEYNSDISNQVATKTQTYKQDEKILNNSKQEIAQSKNSNLAWKILRIGGKVLKWTFVGAGGVGFLRHVDNSYNSNAKQEILNLIDKYKTLSYNERLDGFIKVAEELIAKNEKAKAKRKKNNSEKEDIRTKDSMFDRTFYGKSKDDMNNTSFGKLKDGKSIECADLTNILQVMALELGLICYNIIMRSTKGGDGHSVLMIAQKSDNSNGEKKFSWYVIDGQNYLTIRSLLEKFPYWSKKYPKIPLSKMIPIYTQTEVFGYDKVYIVKNKNFIYLLQFDTKREMVAKLNDKLLNRLNEGYDVDWTDDSYVGCFEEFEKDLFKP